MRPLLAALVLGLTTLMHPLTAYSADAPAEDTDPYRWLEEVQGERALAWVRERNAESTARLEADPRYAPMRERLLEILDSRARIPAITRHGGFFYNLWRDEQHKRGLWRRTTLAEYRKAEPAWETVLDLDRLAADEHENWVWSRAVCLGPEYRRCLVALSRGGADATVVREFDTIDKRFVADGFSMPEAKTDITWIDADSVYIGSDFGPGTLTDSGYPRTIKRWHRGHPLADAPVVFEGQAQDVSVSVDVDRTPGFERTVFTRALDFYNTRQFLLNAPTAAARQPPRGGQETLGAAQRFLEHQGRLQPIDKPDDATLVFWKQHLLLELRSALQAGGTSHPQGSLLVADAAAYLRGERRFQPLFTPSATRSLAAYAATRTRLILTINDNVASRLEALQREPGGRWQRRRIAAPYPGTLGVRPLHDDLLPADPLAEDYLLSAVDFLTPHTLSLARAGSSRRELLKSDPAFFDASGMRVEQRWATSKDGTRVPYFIVWPQGAQADGDNPTLLYGYGGFEVSLNPWYGAASGSAWGARGGVFVVANIRGGGEFGPGWHQQAVKANKQKSYDDFIAVAEDLIAAKITRPRRLGIEGGSNGGLLVGAVMLQRPELFGAVVCQVPLLDMRRFHKLLAGASWIGEYGDPDDPAQWAAISRYSPYQRLQALPPGTRLPAVLLTTSTRDDRVHPGHARKMAARLLEKGYRPLESTKSRSQVDSTPSEGLTQSGRYGGTLYYENIEGGHGGAADNAQRAMMMALEYTFLWQQLGK